MVNTEHCGSHKPWQAHASANLDEEGQNKQVQVISTSFLQLIFFTIDDHSSYLLVHKYQDGAQNGWDYGDDAGVERIFMVEREYEPAAIRQCWFKLGWNL